MVEKSAFSSSSFLLTSDRHACLVTSVENKASVDLALGSKPVPDRDTQPQRYVYTIREKAVKSCFSFPVFFFTFLLSSFFFFCCCVSYNNLSYVYDLHAKIKMREWLSIFLFFFAVLVAAVVADSGGGFYRAAQEDVSNFCERGSTQHNNNVKDRSPASRTSTLHSL